MSSSYVVKELQTRGELDEVVEVIWKAQFNPYMPSTGIFWPIFGHTPDDRARAVQVSKDRLWNDWSMANHSKREWIIVEHIQAKKIGVFVNGFGTRRASSPTGYPR